MPEERGALILEREGRMTRLVPAGVAGQIPALRDGQGVNSREEWPAT